MTGWIWQWYGKLPADGKVAADDEPAVIVPVLKKPPTSEVAVCETFAVFVKVTVTPWFTTSEDGVNEKLAIETVWLPA
jgi:hypothetical protein